jgi:spore coat protein U-like protein
MPEPSRRHAERWLPVRSFFEFDPFFGTGQLATAIVTLTCTSPRLLATIAITSGHANQFSRYREMWRNGIDSSQAPLYNLYMTSNDNVVWGDGSSGSSPETVNQSVTTFNAMIFAKILYPQAPVAGGAYSDIVTVMFNLSP